MTKLQEDVEEVNIGSPVSSDRPLLTSMMRKHNQEESHDFGCKTSRNKGKIWKFVIFSQGQHIAGVCMCVLLCVWVSVCTLTCVSRQGKRRRNNVGWFSAAHH